MAWTHPKTESKSFCEQTLTCTYFQLNRTNATIKYSYYIYAELPVFMCNEECSFNVATVWILSLAIEHFLVMFVVVQINSTIECKQNYLWNLKKSNMLNFQ